MPVYGLPDHPGAGLVNGRAQRRIVPDVFSECRGDDLAGRESAR